jgi:type I restriction enzyme S subunit
MNNTTKYQLSEIADVQTGPFGSQLHMSDYVLSGTPIITVEHFGENKIIHENLPLVSDSDKKRLIKYTLREGDVVFSRVGSVDRRVYVTSNENGWMFSGRCLRVRPKHEKVQGKYLSYYFGQESFKEYIRINAVGATMPSINTQILSEVEINIHPLPEQESIAEVLSSLDDKIDLLHRQNKTLERMAETLFREWFIEDIENNCIPGRVKDICKLPSGFSFKSNSFIENGIYKIITIKNVQNGYLDLKNTDTINIIPSNLPPHCKLIMGDILLSLTGNVGRVCRVTEENLLLNQRVSKVTPLSKEVYEFCLVLFSSNKFRTNLEELARGTAQSNLSPIETLEIEINVPNSEMLLKFHNLTKELFEKHLNNNLQIHKLENLRDTLLPKLMSGAVRVEN